jgi:hypothetical protein
MTSRGYGRWWFQLAVVAGVILACASTARAQRARSGQSRPGGQTQPGGDTHPAGQHNMPMPTPNFGIVSGTVTKATGGPVVGATVVASNATNGIQFSATTDDAGRYALPSLPPGTYDITAQLGGFKPSRRPGVTVGANSVLEVNARLETGDADSERAALLDRIETLEKRLGDIESSAVLSEPETRVKRVEVYVDDKGNAFDEPTGNAKKTVTYQRERVYRRQTINEKIEEAIASAAEKNVKVGVSAAIATQVASRTRGDESNFSKHAYQLSSADLFFTAGLAQYTLFYADIVGLSGTPPDLEISSLSLLNGFSARLVRQNELNLREAWLRTELFGQRLALSAGRLDLTNFFDHNAAANDETTQFISDALVNNPMLGLAVNGTGVAAVYDPKNAFNFKIGFQQSNTDATSLSESIYTLAEVGYTATPLSLPEGNYRVWFRTNNQGDSYKKAFGVSLDQKVSPLVTLFGRYGQQEAEIDHDHYYSAGFQMQNGFVFNPLDTWGIGLAHLALKIGGKETLAEGYYNFRLTERLRLSFHLQHVLDSDRPEKFGYLLPGVRLQAAF